jgi:hypothetical protein
MDTNAELESLRKVHGLLMEAVKTAESAVNAQLAQRRFWLEEICSNIDEEGNLQSTSIWKRPVTVKVPPGKKGSSLKRKKNSLESSSEKPAKKPRTKKESETTRVKTAAAKPPLKRGPTVKIKMRTLPVSAEKRPPSPDSDATESQKDDDDEEDDDGSFSGSYPVAQPSEHNSDSESAAVSNPLNMMVRRRFCLLLCLNIQANSCFPKGQCHFWSALGRLSPRSSRCRWLSTHDVTNGSESSSTASLCPTWCADLHIS